jgi:hypothetical protein
LRFDRVDHIWRALWRIGHFMGLGLPFVRIGIGRR